MQKHGRNYIIIVIMAYFPMFIEIENKNCLVVGGGAVALRKVLVLLDFGAKVHVVAPQILPEICALEGQGLRLSPRPFCEEDLKGCLLAVTATDDTDMNHRVAECAKKAGIAVNAVDQKEDCSFIFPSYVRQQNLVGAFSSGGSSPVLAQYLKKEMAGILNPELGNANEYLGSIRERVKDEVATEAARKKVYQEVLARLLSDIGEGGDGRGISDEELEGLIKEVIQ